ncbi:MAG: hypothetical protein H6668_19835 [Ardenticatenaceae bacterium]|nr:hypothetical protein [Ardenticatenaceae bacterium]
MDTQDIFYSTLHFCVWKRAGAEQILPRLRALLNSIIPAIRPRGSHFTFSQRDAVLITYGDMNEADGEASLATLADFAANGTTGRINTVHIFAVYPYSSDDGFRWWIIRPLIHPRHLVRRSPTRHHFRLMFDAVINHLCSWRWFQNFWPTTPSTAAIFTVVDPAADLTAVFLCATHVDRK